MKNTLITIVILLFSIKLFASDSTIKSETIATPMTSVLRKDLASAIHEEKNWKFILSQSRYVGNLRNIAQAQGSGLSVGLERNIFSVFSLGANYTIFKNEWVYTDDSPSIASDLLQLEGFVSASPFRYDYGPYSFVGSILAGVMNPRNFSQYGSNYGIFYGANIEFSFHQQLGFQLETRVSTEYKSITSLGLVAYY